MQNKIILSSLAMDLKRVAVGLHHKSFRMAERFSDEALLRKNEAQTLDLKPYMKKILSSLDRILKNSNADSKAEDVLMYSTLIQNYALKEQVRS